MWNELTTKNDGGYPVTSQVQSIMILALLSITFLGTGGFLVIRYKLFKMAVCYEITTVTLNLFLIFSACLVNDINIFDYTVLLLALIAAETAMALSLIIGSRGLSGRLSVRNNVSNYSTYLPKCQRLLSGPLRKDLTKLHLPWVSRAS